jgi:hypothetical protein
MSLPQWVLQEVWPPVPSTVEGRPVVAAMASGDPSWGVAYAVAAREADGTYSLALMCWVRDASKDGGHWIGEPLAPRDRTGIAGSPYGHTYADACRLICTHVSS